MGVREVEAKRDLSISETGINRERVTFTHTFVGTFPAVISVLCFSLDSFLQ